ncbi:ATP-binding cassette domain-containing protein [Saccharothrix obliqua]|uniref:ATP-binding cassette domain-containing protein n=1 Tax=Saccharothrix obliqua TaxID=2861747 RepID=UPI001C5E0FEB|nr:ATP-binding cassette domain-containing protein [Saccharothrix obliqua]MBW4721447.1 ATP-binding cassette domain-containing protein [Saccharothrix obliqua]
MTPTIEAVGVRKRFGEVTALDGLDIVAEPGQVVALLGPNGAGKTTFVRAVATLLRPDSGALRVAGVDAVADPRRVRRLIGLAGQFAAVEGAMTGRENLDMVARLFGLDRRAARAAADRVLRQLGLEEHGDRLVRTYSGGLRRRLDLGASLVGTPRVLLLDEPTTGLDPRSRIELWSVIRELVEQGTDMLLTTQYLNEADELADLIAIVDRGRVVAAGSPRELKARAGRDVVEVHVHDRESVAAAARVLAPLGVGEPRADAATRLVSIAVDSGSERLLESVRALAEQEVAVEDIALRRPTLDEVFLALTGTSAARPEDEKVTSP